jgi:2-succinyl-6-hydroxy-2,4-cyclohexadiene-1-carboxylate synthase
MSQIPLFFLPGTQCDDQLWKAVFDLLPACFTPHAIILPQGKNPHDIVQALHNQLPHQDLNLIGFSLGGYLSALYTTLYPAQLNKLLILANAPHALPAHELKTREQTLSFVQNNPYCGIPNKRIEQLLSPTNKHNTYIVKAISDMDKRGGKMMLVEQLANTSQRTDLLPTLMELSVETKFVIGTDDNLVNITTLKQTLAPSHITLNVIDNCGHMSPLESPQAIANHVIDFFS